MARKPTEQEAAEAYAEAQRRIKAWTPGETLNLSLTYLATLPPELTELAGLESLSLIGDIMVQDLSPLAALTDLEVLDLRGTISVDDLAPLAGLTKLRILNLYLSNISDLTPLARLTNLQDLNICAPQVRDLTPLAGLTGLERLDLHGTKVHDLTPLAGLTGLEKGAQKQSPFSGLSFADTPACAADPVLEALSRKNDPERTVETLAYLRKKLADAPLPAPEEVGEQSGHGLHFGGDADGPIALVSHVEPGTDDLAHELHREVREQARALSGICTGRNSLARLGSVVARYVAALGETPHDIRAELLVLRGGHLRLAQAADQKRIADPDADRPAMEIGDREVLDALVQAHNLYVVTDPALAALEPHLEGPDRRPLLRDEEARAFAAGIKKAQIATPEAAAAIIEAADIEGTEDDASTPAATRARQTRDASISNFSIVAVRRVLSFLRKAGVKTVGGAVAFVAGTVTMYVQAEINRKLVEWMPQAKEYLGNLPVWEFIKNIFS